MTEMIIFVVGTMIGISYLCTMEECNNFIMKQFKKVEMKLTKEETK